MSSFEIGIAGVIGLIALVFLASAKVANVGVPLVLKSVVDALSPAQQVLALPLTLLVAYGALRLSTVLFAELRDVVFVRVTQRAIRRVALGVFRHLHRLSLRFHLERQTGGMTRDIERGTRGISTLLSYLLFSIITIASSRDFALMMLATGPKISSLPIVMSIVPSLNTVGFRKASFGQLPASRVSRPSKTSFAPS